MNITQIIIAGLVYIHGMYIKYESIMGSENFDQGVLGIHHVTAIARDPQKNIDFYTGILGLRLVKITALLRNP